MLESVFNKVAGIFDKVATLLKKETLAQVFSREFCEIFKNTFFIGHFRTTAHLLKIQKNLVYILNLFCNGK